MIERSTVLVVDDDPTQGAILKAYFLSMRAYRVHCTTSVSEALLLMQDTQSKIDLIVTDLQMPDIDGLEFMRRLKEIDFTGQIAIVSGIASDMVAYASRLTQMHQLKFVGQVKKPITKSSLDSVFSANHRADERVRAVEEEKIDLDRFEYALAAREIQPFFQPKIDLRTSKVSGAEALARWVKPDGRMIPPLAFVQYAEKAGKLSEFTFCLMEQVFRHLKHIRQTMPFFMVSINLEPGIINDLELPEKLARLMAVHGVQSKNICLEITESSVLNLDTTTLEVLSRLRLQGFDVSVDDFGTGSSNIQTLRDFPFSELKIDKAFVSNVVKDRFSQETVNVAVTLARQLGMRIVAEGVEDTQSLNWLREFGIDEVQGYLVAKPLPPEEFFKFLSINRLGWSIKAA